MAILMTWAVLSIVYVSAFKEDFKQEEFDKALPFLIIVGLVVLVLGVLSSGV